jgi:hypothetical protein
MVAVPGMIHTCKACQVFPTWRSDRQVGSDGGFYYECAPENPSPLLPLLIMFVAQHGSFLLDAWASQIPVRPSHTLLWLNSKRSLHNDVRSWTQCRVPCSSNSQRECSDDCAQDDRCGCAFYRVNDFTPSDNGHCALTSVPCEHPIIGAKHDTTLTHTALHKCDYEPSVKVEDAWIEEPLEWLDWYGVWDYVCEAPNPFEHVNVNTFCGPDCVLDGSYTTKCAAESLAVHG